MRLRCHVEVENGTCKSGDRESRILPLPGVEKSSSGLSSNLGMNRQQHSDFFRRRVPWCAHTHGGKGAEAESQDRTEDLAGPTRKYYIHLKPEKISSR